MQTLSGPANRNKLFDAGHSVIQIFQPEPPVDRASSSQALGFSTNVLH